MINHDDLIPNAEVDPSHVEIIKKLQELQASPPRDAEMALRGKMKFLAQAANLRSSVSRRQEFRLSKWINTLFTKGNLKMSALTPILIMIFLLFGGTGATAFAAQDSLPATPLYPVKILTEQLRTGLTASDPARIELLLQLANRRMEEFAAQIQNKGVPDELLIARWEQHIRECFQVALNQPDKEMAQSMRQIQKTLREQSQLMQKLNPDANAVQIRTLLQEKLQQYLQWMNTLDENPVQTRAAVQTMLREGVTKMENRPDPTPQQKQGQDKNDGQNGYPALKGTAINTPYGPARFGSEGTPTPGSGYGPGNPNGQYTPTPGISNGPGANQNPNAQNTPTPGSSYGPGPGPTQAVSPAPGGGSQSETPPNPPSPGGQTQPQPQPSGQPKGNGK